ncbi:MAG: 50S ribosomal protein L6, partial [Candidatus Hermodarchaeota archaeon]|nr:50S ribosomal protein L6 [Candidatus Hermodarchaeota archaeon]
MPAKTTHHEQSTPILEDTTVIVDGRLVTVKGPKGEIVRDFSHADIEITKTRNNITVSVD